MKNKGQAVIKDISFKISGGYFPLENEKIFENLWA